jgi:signal transduction histidine kinase
VEKKVPDTLIYDSKRLQQILLNLASNALKYTEKGYIRIVVDSVISDDVNNRSFSRRSKLKKKNCEIIFLVSDSGIGIEK